MLRLCLWGEARGEQAEGQLAVAWVIKNRADKQGNSIKEVILAPWQFSSFNHDDPNRDKMLSAHQFDPTGWARINAVCDLFESGYTIDPTKGATHYYVERMPNPPKWGRGHPTWDETAVVGRHVFGKQT